MGEVEVACCPSQLQVALVTAVGQEVGLPRPVLAPSSPGVGGGEGEGEGSSPAPLPDREIFELLGFD